MSANAGVPAAPVTDALVTDADVAGALTRAAVYRLLGAAFTYPGPER